MPNVAMGGGSAECDCANGNKSIVVMITEGIISMFFGVIVGYFIPHRNGQNNQNNNDAQYQNDHDKSNTDVQSQRDRRRSLSYSQREEDFYSDELDEVYDSEDGEV